MAGQSVIEVVQHLCANGVIESDMFLNAPDYLFVSTNVAKKFPHLMESILVQAYVSHLPGELAKTWQGGSHSNMARIQRGRTLRSAASVILMLQYIGTAPFIVHRLFIRFVQPLFFSGLVMLWLLAISNVVYLAVVCAIAAAVIAFAVYRSCHVDGVTPSELRGIAPALPAAEVDVTFDHACPSNLASGNLHLPPLAMDVMPISAVLPNQLSEQSQHNSDAEVSLKDFQSVLQGTDACKDPSWGDGDSDFDDISELSQLSAGVTAMSGAEFAVVRTGLPGNRANCSLTATDIRAESKSQFDGCFSHTVVKRARSGDDSSDENLQFSDTSSSGSDSV
jgi:hypothetical protein